MDQTTPTTGTMLPTAFPSAGLPGGMVGGGPPSSGPIGTRKMDKIFIKDLVVHAILGVNKKERVMRQNININVVMFHDIVRAACMDDVRGTINYSDVCKAVVAYTTDSHHYTLESLCCGIARLCCLQFGAEEVVVHVEKPAALSLARCPAVEVHRTREYFLTEEPQLRRLLQGHEGEEETSETGVAGKEAPQDKANPAVHTAYLALGSNIGQREDNIYKALKVLAQSCEIVSTSALYQVRWSMALHACKLILMAIVLLQTPPAYVVDQPPFLNAACKVRTKLTPDKLLDVVKGVEQQLGRTAGGVPYPIEFLLDGHVLTPIAVRIDPIRAALYRCRYLVLR